MAEYLNNNVILVRTILPDDTDVAAYFEIMNNRGEQLQEHEIVKALMMKSLDEDQRKVFASIWDACSQMNIPIQRSLSSLRNNDYPIFGPEYDSLREDLIRLYRLHDSNEVFQSIDEILSKSDIEQTDNEVYPEEIEYNSIIDFPNFLMLIFKTYDSSCQLNANYLQETYNKNQSVNSMDFVERLLKYRTIFDRFVVKTTGSEDDVESMHWIMKKPYRDKKGSLRFRNTFSMANDEPDENEAENDVQKRIVKQLSMLQVTFRNKKYKNWLFDYLQFLCENNIEHINANLIIKFLDEWMLSFYNQLLKKKR